MTLLAALLALHTPPTEADARAAAPIIVSVAEDRPLWPVPTLDGAESPEAAATAALVGAIGFHESRFQPDVIGCRVRGPGGSVTAYQLLGSHALGGWTVAEVCASPEIATRAALRVLELHRNRCSACVPAQWVAGYASGDPGKGSKAANEIVGIWSTLCRSMGVVCAPYARTAPRWAP